MITGKYNISAKQGATYSQTFTVENDGTPWNLTGYLARMQVRRSFSDSGKLLDLVSPTNITLSSVGVITVTVSASAMADVPSGRWLYDLEVQSTGGEVYRVLEGRFVVSPEVTR
jgi:hypothetical protein